MEDDGVRLGQTDATLLSELHTERDALKLEYHSLRSRSEALYDLQSRLRTSAAFMARLDDGSGTRLRNRSCVPLDLQMLKQVSGAQVGGGEWSGASWVTGIVGEAHPTTNRHLADAASASASVSVPQVVSAVHSLCQTMPATGPEDDGDDISRSPGPDRRRLGDDGAPPPTTTTTPPTIVELHARLLSGGLLPACRRLASALDLAAETAQHAASVCVASLRLPHNLTKVDRMPHTA